MSTHQSESAGPALRGFRLQMLYTLARLTEPRATLQATLWPEGVEDLAIFDDRGVLREAIQIKAHTAPLTLSELVSRRGNGLMQRAVEIARTHPECRVRLLSFGPFGQELQDAREGARAARDRVTGKLKDAGLSPTDVAILFDRLTLERVDEAAEQAKVDGFLGTVPALAGQSAHAAAILCQWLYAAAERRERIAQADLITRLAEVGRYLHARDGYWRDWFSVPGTDLGRIVERLEMEYLVRRLDQGLQLDGLHPVRSRLLADILCDGIAFTPQALARRCLDLLWVDDTESFLLHFASGHAELMPPMVRHLEGWQPRTWAAIGGVLRALLWWGVRQYCDRLSGLVADIMSTIGKAWLFTLDLDLVEPNPDGTAIWRQFDFISDQRKALLQSFLDRQPPKASALETARRWLAGLATPPTPPETHGDWTTVSELSYWAGRWSIDAPVAGWLRAIDLTPVLAQLPLQQVSNLLLGRWELEGERMRAWLDVQRERIAARFREETFRTRVPANQLDEQDRREQKTFDAVPEFTRNDRCQGILARGRAHRDTDQALVLRPRPGERRWRR